MECLNIDFIGPFLDQGYILVIVDTFTRWVELYHTTDATALSAAECPLKHFDRRRAPHQLRSDIVLISSPCWCHTLSYTSLLKRRECYSGKIQQRNQSTLTCSDI